VRGDLAGGLPQAIVVAQNATRTTAKEIDRERIRSIYTLPGFAHLCANKLLFQQRRLVGVFMISSGPVEDRLAIRELVDSYNDAVMRLDGEAWASNWMEDGIWSLPGVGEVAGKAKFYPMWQQAMSAFSFVGFFASAGPIVVTGDTAHGTWYQQEFLHMKAGGKQTITGRYEDDYVRKDGRWYFAKRVYAVLDRQVTE
jgi:ketosteroid isomerase-like protein